MRHALVSPAFQAGIAVLSLALIGGPEPTADQAIEGGSQLGSSRVLTTANVTANLTPTETPQPPAPAVSGTLDGVQQQVPCVRDDPLDPTLGEPCSSSVFSVLPSRDDCGSELNIILVTVAACSSTDDGALYVAGYRDITGTQRIALTTGELSPGDQVTTIALLADENIAAVRVQSNSMTFSCVKVASTCDEDDFCMPNACPIPGGGSDPSPTPTTFTPAYLPIAYSPSPPTPTFTSSPAPSPTPRGFMWKRMPEVLAILDEAALSTHVLEADHQSGSDLWSFDSRLLRSSDGGQKYLYTAHTRWTLNSLKVFWYEHAELCQRGIPEWCDTQYGKLENILFGVKEGGPWFLEYVQAVEAVCAEDPACNWGSLKVWPKP